MNDDGQFELHVAIPGEDLNKDIVKWRDRLGSKRIMKFLTNLSAEPDYISWLKHTVGIPAHEFTGESVEQSLLSLPMSTRDDVGHREVSFTGVAQKSDVLCLQRQWREYDVADICSLQGGQLFYVKFHHRALALHLILSYHYLSKRSVHAEFIEMAQRVRVKFRGNLS